VDCRKVDGVDVAQQIVPISSLTRFLANLNAAQPDLVSPHVPGVRHVPVYRHPKTDDVGVALTVIPQSDTTPHMATGKEHRYIFRNGHQFLQMEHAQVADMFGRRAQPRAKLLFSWKVDITHYSRDSIGTGFTLDVVLANEGRGLLRYPCVSLREQPAGWKLDVMANMIQRPTRGRWWLQFVGGADTAIHPNDRLEVVHMWLNFGNVPSELPDFELSYLAMAENSLPHEGTFRLSGPEIVQTVRAAAQAHMEREQADIR
jgi:hypothetical protein